jgi:hypothetical protein
VKLSALGLAFPPEATLAPHVIALTFTTDFDRPIKLFVGLSKSLLFDPESETGLPDPTRLPALGPPVL